MDRLVALRSVFGAAVTERILSEVRDSMRRVERFAVEYKPYEPRENCPRCGAPKVQRRRCDYCGM